MNHDRVGRRLIAVCRALYRRGLIAGTDGNVSARIAPDRILITPAGVRKSRVGLDDLVVVDGAGTRVHGEADPSTEIEMHLAVYRRRADVGAVVHAHPPAATAFAVAGEDLTLPLLPEIVMTTGPVPLVPYTRSGTTDLSNAVAHALAQHDAVLLANHGATTVGRTLSEAYSRMESLEHGAGILLRARILGGARPLPTEAADALVAAWRQERAARMMHHASSEDCHG